MFIQFQFLVGFLRTTVINNSINVDDQGAQCPSIQTFANQIKCITWEKFKVFFLKVATFGLHLTFLQS